jgi:uncharacterized OB-fold protein
MKRMAAAVQLPSAPEIWPEAAPYWQGAADGVLMLMRCLACEEHYVHPRPFCPHCGSDRTEWREAQGSGMIYTFTVTERAPVFKVPAMVELAEGPIMMTAIVDCEPADVKIGQPVTVSFCPTDGGAPLPVFRPA